MSYYPGHGYGVDDLTRSFGSMGMGMGMGMGAPGYGMGVPAAPGYGMYGMSMGAPGGYGMPAAGYHMRMVPAPAPVSVIKYKAVFKKPGGAEEEKPLDINGVIRMLDMPPATLRMIIAMCDLPNGDTIEIHIIYTHKGRRDAGAYEFHVVAMYFFNKMNIPYARNPDGSIYISSSGTPDPVPHIFIRLPEGGPYGTKYVLNGLSNLLSGYLIPAEQDVINSRLGGRPSTIPGLFDTVKILRSGGAARRRGRSMTRKGKGKRKLTRRRGRKN